MTEQDHYAVLRVTRDAPQEMIRSAYLTLSKRYHPDRNPVTGDEAEMHLINAAHHVLGNPGRRAEYDRRTEERASRPAGNAWPDQEFGDDGWGDEVGWGTAAPPRAEPPPETVPDDQPPPDDPWRSQEPSDGSPHRDFDGSYARRGRRERREVEPARSLGSTLLGRSWVARISGLLWLLAPLAILGFVVVDEVWEIYEVYEGLTDDPVTHGSGIGGFVLFVTLSVMTAVRRVRAGRLTKLYVFWNLLVIGAIAGAATQLEPVVYGVIGGWWLLYLIATESRVRELRHAWG